MAYLLKNPKWDDVEMVLPEGLLRESVGLLVRIVEAAGALIIFLGALFGFVRFVLSLGAGGSSQRFSAVRLTLGQFLALGLEFQLASDLLRTAVAPSFEEIGKLAAVAAIRTGLNFFLAKELKEEGDAAA